MSMAETEHTSDAQRPFDGSFDRWLGEGLAPRPDAGVPGGIELRVRQRIARRVRQRRGWQLAAAATMAAVAVLAWQGRPGADAPLVAENHARPDPLDPAVVSAATPEPVVVSPADFVRGGPPVDSLSLLAGEQAVLFASLEALIEDL
jgi:hypothetical protein